MRKIVLLSVLCICAAFTALAQGAPQIMVDCSSLDFGTGYNGYHEHRSIVVTGIDLTGDISLSITGQDAIDYSVSPKTITAEQAAQGVSVTVDFFPMNKGYRRAALVLSSPGADVVSIPIVGFGIKTSAYLIPEETEMTFETRALQPVTRTLVINRTEFDGWIALGPINPPEVINPKILVSMVGGFNPYFSLGGMCASLDGLSLTVTITYLPLQMGTHTAQLLITGHEAHPVTVDLIGTATCPCGDLDGNGTIGIEDVTGIIDRLLNPNRNMEADVDGDGAVTVGDVTLLIDYILNAK